MALSKAREDVFIFYNDSVDSDNAASALALAKVPLSPNTKVIWILEPRQVSFGLSMSKDDTERCLQLIESHPSYKSEKPLRILLGGLLDEKDAVGVQSDTSDCDLGSFRFRLRWPSHRLLMSL